MEVVAATPTNGGVPPFHDHDVREWSRLDSLTGVLERARLETDHWTANTNNSCHKYGKVVDSRARTNADGALQQKARRQLEVFHSQIPGGQIQVIKTQTVSSSRWSNKTTSSLPSKTSTITSSPSSDVIKDFENLQLALNPLDLTSQKSKANVGRSVGRRPPSRPRAKDESNPSTTTTPTIPISIQQDNLHYKVSRLCHQIHENSLRKHFGLINNNIDNLFPTRENEHDDDDDGGVEIEEIETLHHPLLSRTKSTSSEDLHIIVDEKTSSKGTEDLEDLEELQNWRRTSKLRRSLQFPHKNHSASKPPDDLPENKGSVKKIREELEKGRRLSTALRGNNVDLEALDQILQSISGTSSSSSSSISTNSTTEEKKQKRNSFVTVETLQEVKGRLRRTTDDNVKSEEEEEDDGIVTEEAVPVSRVKSYVFGMENKKSIQTGTGSLESRSKLLNGSGSIKNEDWYNRRKSYGFEEVATEQQLRNNKNKVESSTDSGIYRSSELVRECCNSVKEISSIFDQSHIFNKKSTTITIPISSKTNKVDLEWNGNSNEEVKRHSIAVDESKYVTGNANDTNYRRTSLVINPAILEDHNSNSRKLKKVEFCKTEVHFGEGKVNIVETDEKPPPTHNFRRRRRNSGPILDDRNLPILHFGDTSYEKHLLGVEPEEDETPSVPSATVTVNSTNSINSYTTQDYNNEEEEEEKKEIENVKGILKNKPIKPIPYHLGEEHLLSSDSESGKWGVRLKPVQNDPPYWKSTVTLHNTVYNNKEEDAQPEFQKLLKNLRPISNKPDLIATNKVYSTKVNFGDGGTTVVSNDNKSNWMSKRGKLEAQNNVELTKKSFKIRLQDIDFTPTKGPSSSLKLSPTCEKLSSPSLVHQNNTKSTPNQSKYVNLTDLKVQQNKQNDLIKREQQQRAKKSEMTYFGANSPQMQKKKSVIRQGEEQTREIRSNKLSDKPDLLQHSLKAASPLVAKKSAKPLPPEPIYENLNGTRKSVRDFDANILDELTKAADQILQAVNGFTDEEHQPKAKEPLDTISESKSWSSSVRSSQRKNERVQPSASTKSRLKATPSNSSVESLSLKKPVARKPVQVAQPQQQAKKKNGIGSDAIRASTKARRLQRASSREALLLQSHGSSSEDLGANVVPLRKPRQVKKTRTMQLTMSNGIEMSKKPQEPSAAPRRKRAEETTTRRTERSVVESSLPEIRHKTAVSTIRSTAEKSSRERSANRHSDKKRVAVPHHHRESSKGSNTKATNNEQSATKRSSTVPSKETTNHRISTANIKKCHRSERSSTLRK